MIKDVRKFLLLAFITVGAFLFIMFATMNNLIQFGFLTGLAIVLALLADYFIAPALMVIVYRPKKMAS